MKKILHLILICTLCAGFVACGDDDKDEPEKETPFTWKGDWNDPENPDFKPDGYNPIVGDWISVADPELRIEFTDKRVMKQIVYKTYEGWITRIWAEKYEINDIGIRYINGDSRHVEEYKLIKENGQEYLTMRYQLPADKWVKYKRYKPN